MTFSIVARDPRTGDLGVAVASKFLAVGGGVPWAEAEVGAVATQAAPNPQLGPRALALLRTGLGPVEVKKAVLADDGLADERQLGIVSATGESASHTGGACFNWAGGRTGPNFAAQGNILAGAAVVDALADTFVSGGLPFPELLLACLEAADRAGGDRRGRQSAAILIVRSGGGFGALTDRMIDLRVDDHVAPIPELHRLLSLHRFYFERQARENLLPIDLELAEELRTRLDRMAAGPSDAILARPGQPPTDGTADGRAHRLTIGTARPLPFGWDRAWQQALEDWMGIENLEERTAAPGWIDPAVLAHLRTRSETPA